MMKGSKKYWMKIFFVKLVRAIKYDCPILFTLVSWTKIIATFRYHFDIKCKKSGNFRHFGPTSKIRLSLKSLWNFWSNEPIKIREGDGRPRTGVLDFCVKGQLISDFFDFWADILTIVSLHCIFIVWVAFLENFRHQDIILKLPDL